MKGFKGIIMISVTREDRCCGCGACLNVCPKQCITMKENKDGFRYPVVDQSKCVKCGLCEKVCPYISLSVKGDILKKPIAYYIRSKDGETLKTSASGGIFTELARKVLYKGGIVFGAVFGDKYDEVYHRSVTTLNELPLLQGSKYLQSDMKNCYAEAKKLLQSGKVVLFSGTPCQIAGLFSFLGDKDYENLLTCDLICHGVPTPLALRNFIAEKEKQTGKKVSKYYRDKLLGWKPSAFRIVYSDGTHETIHAESNYISKMFTYYNTYQRNSCYGCRFARSPRIADISLGDYFVEKYARDLKDNDIIPMDNEGYSLITVNTVQGQKFLEQIKQNTDYTQLQLHTVASWCLFQGPGNAANPDNRQMFFYLYNKGLSVNEIYNIMYGNAGKIKKLYYRVAKKLGI